MPAKIFAVIHSRWRGAEDNANLALSLGCDGVFFISHGHMGTIELLQMASEFEFSKTGVNLLGEHVSTAFTRLGNSASMLWSDYVPEEHILIDLDATRDKSVKWYGGVAFKYQPQPGDLLSAARSVRGYVDVLTTSGDATGSPPSLEKLAILAEGFGQKIAVASGVTPENAVSMLPYVDHFLVATGISKDFYTIDADKCKALVDNIRSAE